jgi:hypothetical protein
VTKNSTTDVNESRVEWRSKEKVEELKWCEVDQLVVKRSLSVVPDLARMFSAGIAVERFLIRSSSE